MAARICATRRALTVGVVVGAVVLAGCGQATQVGRVPKPTGHPLAPTVTAERAVVAGPVSARSQEGASARCPASSSVLAGGARADLAGGGAPNPSLRLVGTAPSGAGWAALVATGGVDQPGGRTTAFVLCAPAVPGQHEVTATGAGPAAAASARRITAACPAGMDVVGGGGTVDSASGAPAPPQYFVTGSYPSDPSGAPAASGGPATAWTVEGAIGGMPVSGARIRAEATCAPPSSGVAEVATATRLGPARPRSAEEVTASCGGGTRLVGGGVLTGPPKLGHVLQGLHLRGTFPSDGSGAPPAAGGSASAWSVVANAGGMVTVGARTTAFALCSG